MANEADITSSDWKSTRFWLAIGMTVISLLSVTILAGITIYHSSDKGATSQSVLNSVLPLLGTWVGTILAYYFSKENFEAATKSVSDLAKQITPQEKLQSAFAKDKMISRAQMFVQSDNIAGCKLGDVLKALDADKKGNRVPFLSAKDQPKYILHRSIIDKFLASATLSGKTSTEVAALTVEDLLKDPKVLKMAQAFGVVAVNATLADALKAMNSLDDCQDVFVTQNGSKDEPVLGWVTNVIIQDNAKV